MARSEVTSGGDTKSPLVKPDDRLDDEGPLRVHFYTLSHPSYPKNRSPWWLRAFWWPRPTFSHCSVEWGGFVHNMTIEEGTGFHHADEWREKNPPHLSLVVPVSVSFKSAALLVSSFEHASVQKWKVFLWWARLDRRHTPISCASLVASWVMSGYGSPLIIAGTPDELFDALFTNWPEQGKYRAK